MAKKKERDTCKRCGDPFQCDSFYPYCCEYCEDRGVNPEMEDGDDLDDRLDLGFLMLQQLEDGSDDGE